MLRCLKDGTDVRALARDSGVSQATAYRYLHEALEVVAQRAPNDITDVLDRLRRRGELFVCLDGTLVVWGHGVGDVCWGAGGGWLAVAGGVGSMVVVVVVPHGDGVAALLL